MFKRKKQFRFLAIFLLLLFVMGQGFSLLHSLSHQEFGSAKTLQAEFSKKSSDQKNSENCFFCSFANFQNQISFTPSQSFCVAFFCLAFAFRKFSREKLSYLLNSFYSRAPPALS
jgi:hypothetical protein